MILPEGNLDPGPNLVPGLAKLTNESVEPSISLSLYRPPLPSTVRSKDHNRNSTSPELPTPLPPPIRVSKDPIIVGEGGRGEDDMY